MAWTAAILLLAALVASSAADPQTATQREALRQVSIANNAFSADLYRVLSSQPGNLIVSPMCAGIVLALAHQGAGGVTAQELQTALRLPDDPATVRTGYKELIQHLRADGETTVRVANKVYMKQGSSVKVPFQNVASRDFHAEAEELDFMGDNERAKQTINGWVERTTDGKIKDLLATLDTATLMVLVNAIYFKGAWLSPFTESNTFQEAFHTSPTTQVNVTMMHRSGHYSYGSLPELSARVIELPYRGHQMKMLVILPDAVDGLPAVEAGLGGLNFTKMSREMSHGEVILSLPKFKIESKFELHEKLPDLGVRAMFRPGANLTGITDLDVVVSQVVQKAFVEVTETGTVAAAATAVGISLTSAAIPSRPPVVFRVERPFLFLLLSQPNNVMFVGRVQHPQL